MTSTTNEDAGTRSQWTLLAVALATFMTYLDNNIINVAVPAIQRDLGLSVAGLEWVVSGYILSFAGLLLVGGRLADAFGRKRLFLLGLSVFTLASLAAGLADSSQTLIAARVAQGVGAALVTPTTLAIISATFTDKKARNAAIGIWGAVGALALAVGPLLGGVLSQYVSWEWIFFINIPVGVATFALGSWAITESRESTARGLDFPGLFTSALALVALTYGLVEGHDTGWTSSVILGSFALAAVALAAFISIERRSTSPMVDIALFRERAFTGGTIALMMWAFGLFGIYFFTSLYLQNVLGFSPTKAGAAFVPMALLMAGSAIASERIATRFGPHRSTAFAMFLMATGIASVALLGQDASVLDLMPSLAMVGIGGGLTIPLTTSVLAVMPVEQSGIASAVFNASREVAGLLGITVIGAILVARQTVSAGSGHPTAQAFLTGYRTGLVVAAILVAAGGIAAWIALREKSAQAGEATPRAEDLALAS